MLVQDCRGVLQTALANVKGRHLTRQARLLFDNGADNAFITTSLARQIGADCIGRDTIYLAGFQATRRARSCCNIYRFDIMLQNGDCFTVKAYGTDQITCPIDKYAFDTTANPILTEVTLAEPLSQVNTHVPVDILLGSDYYYKILNTDKQPIVLKSGLVLLDSKLGYIVGGSIDSDGSGRTSLLLNRGLTASYEDDSGVKSLWRLEAIGIKEPYDSDDDQLALKNFNETVEFDDVDQRYQVKWPWNGKEGELPVNYNIAFGRLKALMRILDDDPNLKVKYSDHIKDQLSKGIIEETGGDAANGSVPHYMPHGFVVTPDKTTTKLRIVYDGSSRSRQEALSLNDCMYRGPVILKDICSLLLRFRLHRIGITSDLEKAFLQIGIQEPDRDAVRFLWLKDVDKPVTPDNLQHYRFRRVCFGVVATPFLLGATMVHHLDQVGSSVASEVKESLYVDNVIMGKHSTPEALQLYTEAKSIFASASMNLREWYSNDHSFVRQLPVCDQGKENVTKVLGVSWDLGKDLLFCGRYTKQEPVPITKHLVLQAIAKIYDPCGLWSPVTAPGKWLMQELWKDSYGWDDKLSEELMTRWFALYDELNQVSQCPIQRYYGLVLSNGSGVQLHCFCDASAKAYCAAVYMRLPGFDPVLTFSKCRVSPLKIQTIPRLELLAIVIGCRLLNFVGKELGVSVTAKYVWSDSQGALYWILGKCPSVFVRNRVEEIKQSNDVHFRYASTTDNPADLPTRGMKVKALKDCKLWWHGPDWLQDEDQWPSSFLSELVEQAENELSDETTISLAASTSADVFDLSRFSKLGKLLRVTAYVFRFIDVLKKNPVKLSTISSQELQAATTYWIRRVQSEHFKLSQIRENRAPAQLKGLAPVFFDSQRIRCRRGRLGNADVPDSLNNPKLLPKGSAFVDLLIQDLHERLNHAGLSHVLAQVRSQYWMIRARSEIKRVLRNCLVCRRHLGGHFIIPAPPDLPNFRVSDMRPFCYVGIDYFGPLYVQYTAGGEPYKVWVSLFTCASTRAVHLEVVNRMDAEQFLLEFRRFISLCGTPELVVSDNAKQFHSSKKLFDKLWYMICQDGHVQDFSASRKIQWKFIPEAAPWMGGFYERLVGVVKRSLKAAIGRMRLSLVNLQTCVYEAAIIVNSRPLLYVDDDPNGVVLTPAHFVLRQHGLFPTIVPGNRTFQPASPGELVQQWKSMQHNLEQVWKTWRKAYLSSLHSQWKTTKQRHVAKFTPEEENIVLVHESKLPRGQWRLARIVSLVYSGDRQVRSAKLRLADGKTMVRPIKLLYPLEAKVDRPLVNKASLHASDESLKSSCPQMDVQSAPKDFQNCPHRQGYYGSRRKLEIGPGSNVKPGHREFGSCPDILMQRGVKVGRHCTRNQMELRTANGSTSSFPILEQEVRVDGSNNFRPQMEVRRSIAPTADHPDAESIDDADAGSIPPRRRAARKAATSIKSLAARKRT